MNRTKKANGYVIWQGGNVVVIATGFVERSKNEKTGPMIQIWILRSDMSPVEAVSSGADAAICFDCKARGNGAMKRWCYVNYAQGPQAVFAAYLRGAYPALDATDYQEVFEDRAVRFGAYGDPVVIPMHIVAAIARCARRSTGYTHQWSKPEFQCYKSYLMASVDSVAEFEAARGMGWRTFRVRTEQDALQAREISCPASDEAGHKTQCERCGLCNGATADDRRAVVSIIVHGTRAKNLIQIGGK